MSYESPEEKVQRLERERSDRIRAKAEEVQRNRQGTSNAASTRPKPQPKQSARASSLGAELYQKSPELYAKAKSIAASGYTLESAFETVLAEVESGIQQERPRTLASVRAEEAARYPAQVKEAREAYDQGATVAELEALAEKFGHFEGDYIEAEMQAIREEHRIPAIELEPDQAERVAKIRREHHI